MRHIEQVRRAYPAGTRVAVRRTDRHGHLIRDLKDRGTIIGWTDEYGTSGSPSFFYVRWDCDPPKAPGGLGDRYPLWILSMGKISKLSVLETLSEL